MESHQERITVAVFDDHPLYRQGVVTAIASSPQMQVIGQGSSAKEAVECCSAELPDLVILDVRMPGSGIAAAETIAEECPATRIVMLTVSEDDEDVVQAFRVGANGYVLKGVVADELVEILLAIHAGDVYVPPSLASRVLAEMGNHGERDAKGRLGDLSDRERQILKGVASGDANKEIAYDLGISEKTVKHYMTNILQKLHARNRVEAALLAHDAGLGDFPTRKPEPGAETKE